MLMATSLQARSKVILLLLVPIIVYATPYDWWFSGKSFCLIKLVTGHECWGCGITRACIAALYGNFSDALMYHSAVVIVLPILIGVWVRLIWKEFSQNKK